MHMPMPDAAHVLPVINTVTAVVCIEPCEHQSGVTVPLQDYDR